jgi:predicted nucleotidyltransferase
MKIFKIAQVQEKPFLPRAAEIISILRNHALVGNIGRVKSVYAIGSFAKGTHRDNSDIDVLVEIYPIKDTTPEDFTENKRRKIMNYFVKNNLQGIHDYVHPLWNGRRIDLYFTYDASMETRPKMKLL